MILDTDIGTNVDDALAFALLLALPRVELVGVTTVHGNATLRARIARRLLELAGRTEVPVVAGRSEPLRAPAAPDFHYRSLRGHEGVGLLADDERALPEPDPRRTAGADFILEQAARRPDELTLIAIGPLTNVGLALERDPSLASRLRRVAVMGGVLDERGLKRSAASETNLNADPGAAELLLRSGAPITLVPLDVTLQVYLDADQRRQLTRQPHRLLRALARLIHEMPGERTYLHDPLTVEAALDGEHVSVRPAHVELDSDGPTLRTTEVERAKPNVTLCVAANGPAFAAAYVARLRQAFGRR